MNIKRLFCYIGAHEYKWHRNHRRGRYCIVCMADKTEYEIKTSNRRIADVVIVGVSLGALALALVTQVL